MNMIRCPRGHYYDAEQYESCPHCGSLGAQSNKTISNTAAKAQTQASNLNDFSKTTSFFWEQSGCEPVVGWLVCTAGDHYGEDYRLKSGRNFIGRSKSMDIALEGETSVSRERHASIVYEPKQNLFLAQPGDASSLFYLNGNVVLTPTEIRKNDRLQIGNTELMMIPCCDSAFEWHTAEGTEEGAKATSNSGGAE